MVLQDKLRISNKKLEEYETRFKCQEETTQKLMLEYQARLEESEERLRRQQEDKEIQMKGIISRYAPRGNLKPRLFGFPPTHQCYLGKENPDTSPIHKGKTS